MKNLIRPSRTFFRVRPHGDRSAQSQGSVVIQIREETHRVDLDKHIGDALPFLRLTIVAHPVECDGGRDDVGAARAIIDHGLKQVAAFRRQGLGG